MVLSLPMAEVGLCNDVVKPKSNWAEWEENP